MSNAGVGFDWNIIINAIIALVAIVSLFLSSRFNRQTLKQTKELNDKTLQLTNELTQKSLNVQLFKDKNDALNNLTVFFGHQINTNSKPNIEEIVKLQQNVFIIQSLIKDSELPKLCLDYYSWYLHNTPLPSFLTDDIQKELTEYNFEVNIVNAFCLHVNSKITEARASNFCF